MTEPSAEIGIIATNAATLAQFYVDGMGFRIDQLLEFPQGSVHRMSNGIARLKIHQPSQAPASSTGSQDWNTHSGFRYAAFHTSDAAATVSRAVDAGAAVLTPVTNHRPGACFALIADPDGNVWEILQENPQEDSP